MTSGSAAGGNGGLPKVFRSRMKFMDVPIEDGKKLTSFFVAALVPESWDEHKKLAAVSQPILFDIQNEKTTKCVASRFLEFVEA